MKCVDGFKYKEEVVSILLLLLNGFSLGELNDAIYSDDLVGVGPCTS